MIATSEGKPGRTVVERDRMPAGRTRGMTRWAWLPRRIRYGETIDPALQPGIQVSATTSNPGASVVTRSTTVVGIVREPIRPV